MGYEKGGGEGAAVNKVGYMMSGLQKKSKITRNYLLKTSTPSNALGNRSQRTGGATTRGTVALSG